MEYECEPAGCSSLWSLGNKIVDLQKASAAERFVKEPAPEPISSARRRDPAVGPSPIGGAYYNISKKHKG